MQVPAFVYELVKSLLTIIISSRHTTCTSRIIIIGISITVACRTWHYHYRFTYITPLASFVYISSSTLGIATLTLVVNYIVCLHVEWTWIGSLLTSCSIQLNFMYSPSPRPGPKCLPVGQSMDIVAIPTPSVFEVQVLYRTIASRCSVDAIYSLSHFVLSELRAWSKLWPHELGVVRTVKLSPEGTG
jgi:hypothetical protein